MVRLRRAAVDPASSGKHGGLSQSGFHNAPIGSASMIRNVRKGPPLASLFAAYKDPKGAQAEVLKSILESMEQGVAAFDAAGQLIVTNNRFHSMSGIPQRRFMPGTHFLDIARYAAALGAYGTGDSEELAQKRWSHASNFNALYRFASVKPNGRLIEVVGRPMPDGGFVNTYTDVTEAREVEAALRKSEERYRVLAEHSGDVVSLNDMDGTARYISPAAERLLGWRIEELMSGVRDFVHPEDQQAISDAQGLLRAGTAEVTVCYRFRRSDDSWQWVEGHARLLRNTESEPPSGYVVVLRDATERKITEFKLVEALQRMERMATTDALTGLANRRQFDTVADKEWLRCARDHLSLSVLMIDVDHFKLFNDRYGHIAGDNCLRDIVVPLNTVARRPGDLSARYGGEEFVHLLPDTGPTSAQHIAERLCQLVRDLGIGHEDNGGEQTVTVSIGVATAWPGTSQSPIGSLDVLLTAADRALYQAKAGGRNRVVCATDTCPSTPDGQLDP